MAHWSENANRLEVHQYTTAPWERAFLSLQTGGVHFLCLPTTDICVTSVASQIASWCRTLSENSVICIYCSPQTAAELIPYLEGVLRFQLWVAVKRPIVFQEGGIPYAHHALLIFTRYQTSLRHTKTRIQYTYCPACGRTTKDYGGKKHVYHEYGTLISDVWRDIECDPDGDIHSIVDRLRDLFGLPPFRALHLYDLRGHKSVHASPSALVRETQLEYDWSEHFCGIPLDSKLINDDCLSALRNIPSNSIDFCFADPPYNLKKRYDHWNDSLESREYFDWCDQWLTELARVLKPGRTLAVINIPLWAVRHYQHLSKHLNFQSWIVWEALSFPVRMIMPAHYTILCFSKGTPRPVNRQDAPNLSMMEKQALTPLAEGYCLRSWCIRNRTLKGTNDTALLTDLWYDIHR